MVNWSLKLMLLILVNQLKTLTTTQKLKDKIEDKIPNHDKYITTPEFNKLTKGNSDERFKQANFTSKNGTDDLKHTDFNDKLIPTKGFTKDLINGCSIYNGAKYFARDVSQIYLLFQPVLKYFKTLTNSSRIIAWKSKGILERSIKSPHRPYSLG